MDAPIGSRSFTAWLRDRAYDAVFHAGDTALQFTADMIRGPESARHDHYTGRQLKKQERKLPAPAATNTPTAKPLNYTERQAFLHMTERKAGESLIEHWKRRKQLLQHPDKRQLIEAEQKVEALAEKELSITVERRTIASDYQQSCVRKKIRSRKRSR